MLKTLDRYILRAFFTNYFIALAVMIGLYVILDLFVNLDEFTEVKSQTTFQTLEKIVDFYGYNLFLYFAQLAGVITLVAACFTLGRFHRTNELTAVLASGTSLYRVATPVLLGALAMNALWFADQEFIIPTFASKLARKHADVEGRHTYAVWFQPDRNNALVSASMFHPSVKEMRGVVIIKRDANARMNEIIRADRARWDEERRLWHLENGHAMRLGTGGDELGHRPITEYDSDLTPKELALQQATQWTTFLSLPELNKMQRRFGGPGRNEFIRVKHTRLTTVMMNMILLCLGLPFFLNRERPSIIVAGGKCLFVCGSCYALTFFCHSSLDLTMFGLSAALPAWLPVLLFAPIAVLTLDNVKT